MPGTSSPLLGCTREVSAQGAGGQGLGSCQCLDMSGSLSLYSHTVLFTRKMAPHNSETFDPFASKVKSKSEAELRQEDRFSLRV